MNTAFLQSLSKEYNDSKFSTKKSKTHFTEDL
jgi:hypothetical protein